ncbi:protein outspread-like isoform X1 [Centruroides sculpturatus]|uniref:protein outspread-like isoform X1 n=2 Tax=Centruroides sculpturatus TaxID=218467 RepID=UPI000C6DB5BB|nr:protein outspread-like isoform X1 [Centruroides sculpturatus]
MSGLKTDCKKFSPNIFNKTKCQNCFRTKDAHSAEALECNRATRKVSKCGYLFVAPDWDFTVSINRTKRWQRRWFVLYDDGELTYSVDEHPDTVPQAVIDMNHVLEVADAEDITGNQFALAITAPEKVHFIKGTCRDESKWWFDILSRYPKNTIRGKHKRNATFPGLKATLITENETKENKVSYENRIFGSRPRFLSCNTDNYEKEESNWAKLNDQDDVFPTKESQSENLTSTPVNKGRSNSVMEYLHNHFVLTENTNNTLNDKNSFEEKNSIINTSNEKSSKVVNKTHSEVLPNEKSTENLEAVKGQSRRYLKRESRGLKSQRSRSDGVSKMVPPLHIREENLGYWSGLDFRIKKTNSSSQEKNYHHNPVYLLLSDVPSMKKYESLESIQKDCHSPLLSRQRHISEKVDVMKSLTLDAKSENQSENRDNLKTDYISSTPLNDNNDDLNSTSCKNGGVSWGKDNKKSAVPIKFYQDNEVDCQVRGDPDGCGLDGISVCCLSNTENRLERNSEDIFLKKGWLMRYNIINGWCKHWFVLQNSSLAYYQDPTAEESGVLDGVIDIGLVKSVVETDSDRNYAFTITMADDKKHLLSAVTAGIRNNWIQALVHIGSIWNNKKETLVDLKSNSEINADNYSKENSNRTGTPPSPAPSLDEPDKALDVSSSDDHSEYFSVVDEGEFIGRSSSPRQLPPSPPLNRTAISRVKERARSRSSSRSRASHQFWSSGSESHQIGIDVEHSDGGVSDNSNSSFHGVLSLSDRKGIYYEHSGLMASDNDDNHPTDDIIINNKNEKRKTNDSNRKTKYLERHDGNKEQKMNLLEEHCRELEIKLKKKEEEVGEKAAELNNLKSLKGSYHDLVEKYNSLKKRLEDCEKKVSTNNEGKSYRLKYESLRTKYKKEKAEWENKAITSNKDVDSEDILIILEQNKKQLNELKAKLEKSPLKKDTLWSTWKESTKLCEEVELLAENEKKFKKDIELIKLRNSVADLEVLCGTKQEELEKHKRELRKVYGNLEKKENEIGSISNELMKAIEENRSIKEKIKSLDDHSKKSDFVDIQKDQTSQDSIGYEANSKEYELTGKYDRAKEEIRNLKKQLREAHNAYDELELHCFKLEQDMKGMEELHHSQMALMTARVDDLTMKFTTSERNLRALRQKLAKVEAKQERRRSSLKGKEALNLSKEYEVKLTELEQKITTLETALQTSPESEVNCRSSNENENADSLESPSSCQKSLQKRRSSQDCGEAHGMLLRLHNLDTKVKKASSLVDKLNQSNSESVSEKPKILLQVKVSDGTDVAEESEEWSSLSVTASMTDLSTIDGGELDHPQSGKECLDHLSKKVKSLLSWLKNVLENLRNQEISSNTENYPKTDTEMNKIIDVLEYMCSVDTEKLFNSTNKEEKEFFAIIYKLLLIQEVARTLCKLNDFEKYKYELIRQYLIRINHMLIFLEQHLNHISEKSISGNKEIQNDSNNIIKFTKKLFSCDQESESFLFNENSKEHRYKEMCNHLCENFEIVDQKSKSLSELTKKFVNTRQKELFDYLNDGSTKIVGHLNLENDQEILLSEMNSIVSQIVGQLENQLLVIENQQTSFLKYEWEVFYALNYSICKSVNQHTTNFLSEMREILLKSQENYYGASHLKFFTDVVNEIASIIVMNSMIIGSVAFLKDSIDNIQHMSSFGSVDINSNKVNETVICERLSSSAKWCLGLFQPVSIQNILCSWCCNRVCANLNVEMMCKENTKNLTSLKQKYKDDLERERKANSEKLQLLEYELNKKYECENCQKAEVEIQELKKSLERNIKQSKSCDNCEKLTRDLESLSKCLGDLNLTVEQERELSRRNAEEKLKQEKDHGDEMERMKRELLFAQKHIQNLKEEYDSQISSLQSAYEQKLSQNVDVINEEAVRKRYHSEIEQLKCLCCNGLTVMEKFHQHTVAELERKHREEIASLEQEKEKALAEETQATLTALEALKKAHKAELQNEIIKFKENYIQKMQLNNENKNSRKEYEYELGEIRQDILSLSEKYSVKCLENASLEEKLIALQCQLQESNFQLFDLIARNKQLRAYLASDIAQKLDILQNGSQLDEMEKLKKLLSLREGELTKQQEEIAQLKQELHLAQTHADTLDSHCKQLDNSLKSERTQREEEIKSLQLQLKAVLSNSSLGFQEGNDACSSPSKQCKIAVTCGRELARSVSYPSLHRLPVLTAPQTTSGTPTQNDDDW